MRAWIDLCESGNVSPYQWTEQSSKLYMATFTFNDVGYLVKAYRTNGTLPPHEHPEPIWVLGFAIDDETALRLHGFKAGRMNPTNLGHPFRIIATVQTIFDDFIEQEHPETVYFSAMTQGQRGRKPLYKRFADHLVSTFGYHYDTEVMEHFAELEHPTWILRA